MDAGADHPAALAHGAQSRRHQLTRRRIDDRGIQRHRRQLARITGPDRAQRTSEILRGHIARAAEGIDIAPLPARHLHDDMRRGTEAVQPETLAVTGLDQRTPADQPGAEQRCQRHGIALLAEGKGEARVGHHVFGIAARPRVTGELRRVAEVFLGVLAIAAGAAGMPEPGNADPLAQLETADAFAQRIDAADNLVTRDDRQRRLRQLAVHHVQVGATDAASQYLDPQLPWPRLRLGQFAQLQRLANLFQQHGAHRRLSFRLCSAERRPIGGKRL